MKSTRRLLALALVVAAAVGVTWLSSAFGTASGVESARYALLDFRQRLTTETFQPGRGGRESEVALVLFDRASVMGGPGNPEAWPYLSPFPRVHLAELIDALSGAGARTIGLDVYLDRLYPELNQLDGGDDRLAEAIERAGNVVLVAPMEETDSGYVVGSVHPRFGAAAAGIGTAEVVTSFETYRDGVLAARSGRGLVPSFALALYAHSRGLGVDSLLDASGDRISLPGLPSDLGEIPEGWRRGDAADRSYLIPFPIRYAGPPSGANAEDPPGTFQASPSSLVRDMARDTPFLLPAFFQDKIVLLGTGFHDSDKFRTPFYGMAADPDPSTGRSGGEYSWMYGVEVHANMLQDMLDGEYIRRLGAGGEVFLLFLVALLAGGFVFWRGAAWGGAAVVVVATSLVFAALWLWAGVVFVPGLDLFHLSSRFLWVPVVTPLLAGALSYVFSVAYVSMVEGREKRFIKGAFGKFVSPAVVAEIAQHPESLQLGGQKRPLSLLFSDLAGFTTLSEKLDPQELLSRLNEYLSDMTDIVLREEGTLDKYIGDAIMAFWNAPKGADDHADRALRTAVIMQRKMADLNARWREQDPDHTDLVVRIGINTGTVVVGNVGGEDRFDYSAIGDAVNLAARLEPANKTYGTLNMTSEFTLDAARAVDFRVRELDFLAVKGKIEPVRVYELLEMADRDLPDHREEALAHFEAGFRAYKGRDWELASKYFEAALEADPDDGPSRVYLDRAEQYAAEPPPADWDFVVRRTVK